MTSDKSKKGGELLKLEDIQLQLCKQVILKDINVAIRPGEIFGFVGVSGAGKTLLLELLIGYIYPTNGSITYKDEKRSFSIFESTDTRLIFKTFLSINCISAESPAPEVSFFL